MKEKTEKLTNVLKEGLINTLLEDFFKKIPPDNDIVLVHKRTGERIFGKFEKYLSPTGMIKTSAGEFSLRYWYFNTAEGMRLRRQRAALLARLEKIDARLAELKFPLAGKSKEIAAQTQPQAQPQDKN